MTLGVTVEVPLAIRRRFAKPSIWHSVYWIWQGPLVLFLLAASGAFAQPEPMAFEVASTKPSVSADSRSNAVVNDGGILLTNVILR